MANGAMSTATNNDLAREKSEMSKMGMGDNRGLPKVGKSKSMKISMKRPKLRSFSRSK